MLSLFPLLGFASCFNLPVAFTWIGLHRKN
jgi:hypothetical protein